MSTSTSVDRDLVVSNMASLEGHDSNRTVSDDDHPTTHATADLQAAGETSSLSKMNLPRSEFSANSSTKTSPHTVDSLTKKDLSTSPSTSSAETSPDAEAACTTIQTTTPVPVVYPPRRPNIFKTGQKHVRFPVSGLSAVAPRTIGTTTQELEAADGFAVADLQEFQAEIRDKMKKKSEMFMKMVRQNAWQGRRVEDLGEVFAIED